LSLTHTLFNGWVSYGFRSQFYFQILKSRATQRSYFKPIKYTQNMSSNEKHRFAKLMKSFDLNSYLLGINCGFAEVVGSGCKRLALSSPLIKEQFKAIWEPTKKLSEEYGVHLYVDRDFLTTRLFDPLYTQGKVVIHIVKSLETVAEYQALKELKKRHEKAGTLEGVEEDIARSFGRLLSYDDNKIDQLLNKQKK